MRGKKEKKHRCQRKVENARLKGDGAVKQEKKRGQRSYNSRKCEERERGDRRQEKEMKRLQKQQVSHSSGCEAASPSAVTQFRRERGERMGE